LGTPSNDFQHVLRICSDHSWEGTLIHRGDTSCEHQSLKKEGNERIILSQIYNGSNCQFMTRSHDFS
jgi:hypothetical protein